ncbi:unnamed protein product [Chrysoparadoxa australica]
MRTETKLWGLREPRNFSLALTPAQGWRTEHGCDAIIFFKNESCSDCWGEYKYTGGRDSGTCNWPGINQALLWRYQLPGSSFVIINWGWRMRVTPELGELDPSGLSNPELEAIIAYLGAAMYDLPCPP